MALFQCHEWWATHAGEDKEEFDFGCLCVANIDNEPNGKKKIIVGSHMGFLRIYYPRSRSYKIEDLVLEKNLESPVLQLAAGRFVDGTQELSLAVLHPHCLIVYVVSAILQDAASPRISEKDLDFSRSTSSSSCHICYDLTPAYSHVISRPSFNMCYGPFGNQSRSPKTRWASGEMRDRGLSLASHGHEKDFLCVQSLDGVLNFYEQEGLAFSRILPSSFLLPGPLVYSEKSDLFITCNAERDVEAYTYASFANANDADPNKTLKQDFGESYTQLLRYTNQDQHWQQHPKVGVSLMLVDASASSYPQNGAVTNALQPKWRTGIGEYARHIELTSFSSDCSKKRDEIMVIGEHTLFLLTDKGTIQLQKRIVDYPISAAVCYPVPHHSGKNQNHQNLLVTSATGHLMVFQQTKLLWAAKLPNSLGAVVHVVVSEVSSTMGMIIVLDEKGMLAVLFLGTAPSRSKFINTKMKTIDYEQLGKEHHRLLNEIRKKEGMQQLGSKEDKASHPGNEEFNILRKETPSSFSSPIVFSANILDRSDSNNANSDENNDDDCYINEAKRIFPDDDFLIRSRNPRKEKSSLSSSNLFGNVTLAVDVQLRDDIGSADIEDCVMLVEASNTALVPKIESKRFPLTSMSSQRHETVEIPFCVRSDVICSSLIVSFSVSFFLIQPATAPNNNGSPERRPGNVLWEFELPFRLAAMCIRRSKVMIPSSTVKLAFQSSNILPCLQNLFQDLVTVEEKEEHYCPAAAQTLEYIGKGLEEESKDTTQIDLSSIKHPQVFSIEYSSGTQVTAVTSPVSPIFFVVASDFASLSLFTHELFKRLSSYFDFVEARGRETVGFKLNKPFHLSLLYSLPLQEYCQLVEEYSASKRRGIEFQTQLADITYQYRVIQERLFVRFKNRTPSSLNHFDTLLHLTYERLVETCDKQLAWREEFCQSAQALSAGTRLLLLLMQTHFELDDRNFSILKTYLDPTVRDEESTENGNGGDGWLVDTADALEYLVTFNSSEEKKAYFHASSTRLKTNLEKDRIVNIAAISHTQDDAKQKLNYYLTELISMFARGERLTKK